MPNRWCPRCHSTWEEGMFVEPLSICLVCYGRNPGNQGLPIAVLIDKASKSRYARRRKNKDEAEIFASALREYALSMKVRKDVVEEPINVECDFCKQEVLDVDVVGVSRAGENQLCCRGCLPDALKGGAVALQTTKKPVYVDNNIASRILQTASKRKSGDES